MSENPVLRSTYPLVKDLKYVNIDLEAISSLAESMLEKKIEIPSWDSEVFLDGADRNTIDFFMVGNSINFAYDNFDGTGKFKARCSGMPGAYGMFSCLKDAISKNKPMLSAEYLRDFTLSDAEEVFDGDPRMPMLEERKEIFNEVGSVLLEKYDGNFWRLFDKANYRLFDFGNGIVERLTRDFPSFDDSAVYNGNLMRFDKRAQLGPGMIYGRFLSEDINLFEDVDKLTVFADYQLPMALVYYKILKYSPDLEAKIKAGELIPKKSREENEIRVSTIHASQWLKSEYNQLAEERINSLHVDAFLWFTTRLPEYKRWLEEKGFRHHLTITTDY